MKDSFAAKATKIKNKYKKRLGDDFTKRDMLAEKGLTLELNKLKKEQEAVKAAEEFDNEFGQFEQLAKGGQIKIKPSKVGTFTKAAKKRGMGVQEFANKIMSNKDKYSPTMVKKATFASNAAKWKKEYGGSLLPKYRNPNKDNQFNMNLPSSNEITLGSNPIYDINVDPNLVYPDKDYITVDESNNTPDNYRVPKDYSQSPEIYQGGVSAVPLAASLAGSALLYGSASRYGAPDKVKFDRVVPETVNLSADRDQALRDAELAKNINLRNARGLGLNAGATATMGVGALADINKVAGDRISRSYLQEQLANAQARNRASEFNATTGTREDMFNATMQEDYRSSTQAAKDAAIQNAIQSVSQYFTDTNKSKQSAALTGMISDEYDYYYNPEQSKLNRYVTGPSYIKRYNKSTT